MLYYYREKGGVLKLDEQDFETEKDLQELCENNLYELFGLKLVASELSIKDNSALKGSRFDSLAYDKGTNSFVVIEYKKEIKDEEPEYQASKYMKLMLTNKGKTACIKEFSEKFQEKRLESDFNWKNVRYILVAPFFGKELVQQTEKHRENLEDKRYFPNFVQVKHYPTASLREVESSNEGETLLRLKSMVHIDWLIKNMPDGTSAHINKPSSLAPKKPIEPQSSTDTPHLSSSSRNKQSSTKNLFEPHQAKKQPTSNEHTATKTSHGSGNDLGGIVYYTKPNAYAYGNLKSEWFTKYHEKKEDQRKHYRAGYVIDLNKDENSFSILVPHRKEDEPSIESKREWKCRFLIATEKKESDIFTIQYKKQPSDKKEALAPFLKKELNPQNKDHFELKEQSEPDEGIVYKFVLERKA